ncbi:MAG: four helix bundle protein [Bacteroidota bacterium]
MERVPKFKFEKFRIWRDTMDLGEEVNTLTDTFPQKELYNLSSQACCAIDSVALNISEGAILQSNAEFRKFLGYSIRSLAEVVSCLHRQTIESICLKKSLKNSIRSVSN